MEGWLKRKKCPELPDLYVDVWRAVIQHLEWPERLGMRVVCKDLHGLQELSLKTISQLIRTDLIGLTYTVPYDEERVLRRNLNYYGPITYIHMLSRTQETAEQLLFISITPRLRVPFMRGIDIIYMLRWVYRCRYAADVARTLGSSRPVRAMRIAGYIKMTRPKNWETFFLL